MWASSFKHLYYKRNWMYERNTEVYMYMVFFHTDSNRCDVEFFADSFYDSLYWFLNWFRKTSSSLLRNPYYVIPAVIDSMGCFSVHYVDLYSVMYTLDTLVTIGLKTNGVLYPEMEKKASARPSVFGEIACPLTPGKYKTKFELSSCGKSIRICRLAHSDWKWNISYIF